MIFQRNYDWHKQVLLYHKQYIYYYNLLDCMSFLKCLVIIYETERYITSCPMLATCEKKCFQYIKNDYNIPILDCAI